MRAQPGRDAERQSVLARVDARRGRAPRTMRPRRVARGAGASRRPRALARPAGDARGGGGAARGDEAGVDAAFASATGRMPFELALMRVLAAEIIAGPSRARWLREALDIYEVDRAWSRTRPRAAAPPRGRRRRCPAAGARRGRRSRRARAARRHRRGRPRCCDCVGDGLSNAAIAERLYLSVRTVETHVSSLLSKLHVEGRGQLTALSATIDYGRTTRRLAPVVSRMCVPDRRADHRRRQPHRGGPHDHVPTTTAWTARRSSSSSAGCSRSTRARC